MTFDPNGMEVLEKDDCLLLLSGASTGRVSVTMDALPVIIPVSFVLTGTRVTFPTGTDPKLLAAIDGAVVAFEADGCDLGARIGWSVLVQGVGQVTDTAADHSGFPLGAVWAGAGLGLVVSLETDRISGRRTSRVMG